MAPHLKFVSLKCANCGGALEVYDDMERFACGYCGMEQIVERRGGTIGLRFVADAVARVQVGTDKTAAELALVRLEKERTTIMAQWHVAEADYGRRNPYSSSAATFGLVVSVCALPVALAFLAEGEFRLGSVVFSIIVGCGAICGLVLALKVNADTRKRFKAGRVKLWQPFAAQVAELEKQMEKQRQIISGV